MTTKSATWRPGATVCRCCLAEGCYKDIATEYFWMGKREVYSEMLNDTFDVSIAYSQAGGPNSNSRLICEPCISRLRDASEFKRQVQECEKTFMQYLEPGSSATTEVNASVDSEKDVKLEDVKQEKEESDEDYGLPDDFPDDDGDDDDDIDDQPLTKLASKIPKKEEEAVDLLDFLDPPKVAEKRKSAAKAKSSPAKKAKTTEAKASVSKVKSPPEKKKKEDKLMSLRQNAEAIVQFTTAYPFQLSKSNQVACMYCETTFDDPSLYGPHMEEFHKDYDVKTVSSNIFLHNSLRVDCTDLKCRLCCQPFGNLNSIADHLHETHKLHIEGTLPFHPFKFIKQKLCCGFCDLSLPGYKQLHTHFAKHFPRHVCETCGKCYSTPYSLESHRNSHLAKKYPCPKCQELFETKQEKRDHVESTQQCWMYVCRICKERFLTYKTKQSHLVDVHKLPEKEYRCTECADVFPTAFKYREHFQFVHSGQYLKCVYCDKKYLTNNELDEHVVIHTREKKFMCPTCPKGYPRMKGLKRHLLTHQGIGHFCFECNKKFDLKSKWLLHLKTHA